MASPNFGLANQAYRAFRPPYPAAIYDRILAALAGPRRLAVDIGAGTGLVTAALCERFERVIAVEPDAAMAAHIPAAAELAGVQLVEAQDAQVDDASVDLVTSANAFYWMDGPAVARAIAGWLRPGGLFAAWRYLFPSMPAAVDAVFREEIAERWGRYQDRRVTVTGQTRAWIDAEPGLECVVEEAVPNFITMSPAQMVGFGASTSFGSAYLRSLAPEDARRYLADLERRLIAITGGEPTRVDFELILVIAAVSSANTSRRTRSGPPRDPPW